MDKTVEQTIEQMKAWCLANYDNGADTMVECWETEDYEDLINTARRCHGRSWKSNAWKTLRSVAAIYKDQQQNAKIEAGMW